MFIDTHVHYDHPRFDRNRAALLRAAQKAGIEAAVNVAIGPETNQTMRQKLADWPFVWYAAGVHPAHLHEISDSRALRRQLSSLAKDERTVAIGETGIDLHYTASTLEQQKKWFRSHIELAQKFHLPLIIHTRDAHEETLSVLREYEPLKLPAGVIHCFLGDYETAKQYLDLGFCLGIGGALTYPWDEELRLTVARAPLTRILLETDSPYMQPYPKDEPFNTSQHGIPLVAQMIAELKGTSAKVVGAVTSKTARTLFYRMDPANRKAGDGAQALLDGIARGFEEKKEDSREEDPDCIWKDVDPGPLASTQSPEEELRLELGRHLAFLRSDWQKDADSCRGFIRDGVLHIPPEVGVRLDKEMYVLPSPDGFCLIRVQDFEKMLDLFDAAEDCGLMDRMPIEPLQRFLASGSVFLTTRSMRTLRLPEFCWRRLDMIRDGEVEFLSHPHEFSNVLCAVRSV